jgi:DNA-binding PadR family transcriptional regulator
VARAEGDEQARAEKMLRDFFLGFVRVHLLHHASRGPVYGVSLIEGLAPHGYYLSPGTVYPLLHRMEEVGFLSRRDGMVEGKLRKYYSITPLGEQLLAEARGKIEELVREILPADLTSENGEQERHFGDVGL